MFYPKEFDVIVVGGGHAGTEAAAAAARLGAKTCLLTHKAATVGEMSCNPAIGGIAKGTLVREIDALDGIMGRAIDRAGIHYRMLNASKGPAVRGPRAQADRKLYREAVQSLLSDIPTLTTIEDAADDLNIEEGKVIAVIGASGTRYNTRRVVLTTGTFLNGLIHCGEVNYPAGRVGEKPSVALAETLHRIGFTMGRLKTGTPARLDGSTIGWSNLTPQPGDNPPTPFSYMTDKVLVPQIDCYITHTTQKTHDIIRANLTRSPMYSGQIKSTGPRYCPSIEDKVVRFSDRERHQVFLEPEGLDDVTVYPNGISTSLPEEVQAELIKSIPGLENAKVIRYGYAIEYDYFPPTQLKMSLETHLVQGLFFAGQINGTTGYEEAACQGLMAGINAARYVQELEPFILSRSDAYIGVLIDDLINKGTNEPYRMFTSRAEFRILLRQDNADIRLTPLAQNLGMTDMEDRMERVHHKNKALSEITDWFKTVSGDPDYLNTYLESVQSAPLRQKIKLDQIITRPNVQINDMAEYFPPLKEMLQPYDSEVIQLAETQMKYEAYIQKEMEMVSRVNKLEDMKLSADFDYSTISSLSLEAREKLNKHKPTSLGQAGRISGINPADISVLLIHLRPG